MHCVLCIFFLEQLRVSHYVSYVVELTIIYNFFNLMRKYHEFVCYLFIFILNYKLVGCSLARKSFSKKPWQELRKV